VGGKETHLEGGYNVRRFDTPRLLKSSRQVLIYNNNFVKNYRLRRSALIEQIGWRERSNILWPTIMEFIYSILQDSVEFCGKIPSIKPRACVGDSWFGGRTDSPGC
jgi:hypothetical protein